MLAEFYAKTRNLIKDLNFQSNLTFVSVYSDICLFQSQSTSHGCYSNRKRVIRPRVLSHQKKKDQGCLGDSSSNQIVFVLLLYPWTPTHPYLLLLHLLFFFLFFFALLWKQAQLHLLLNPFFFLVFLSLLWKQAQLKKSRKDRTKI